MLDSGGDGGLAIKLEMKEFELVETPFETV